MAISKEESAKMLSYVLRQSPVVLVLGVWVLMLSQKLSNAELSTKEARDLALTELKSCQEERMRMADAFIDLKNVIKDFALSQEKTNVLLIQIKTTLDVNDRQKDRK